MSAFKLSVTAAEFKPATVAPSVTAVTTQHQHQQSEVFNQSSSSGQRIDCQEGADWHTYDKDNAYDYAEGDWDYFDEGSGQWVSVSAEQQASYDAAGTGQQQQQQQQGTSPAAQLGTEEAVTLLRSWFPSYAPVLLQQLLEGCGRDVQQAATILTDMEFEQRRERIAAAAAAASAGTNSSSTSSRSGSDRSRKVQDFSYALEQFPALGDASVAQGPSSKQQSVHSSSWASITAASKSSSSGSSGKAASMPHTRRQPPQQPGRSRLDCGQDDYDHEAVPWVETGAAVSQEYASARAEASDHARLRNACFQQATIAYMAGNKALAKELSAKGRAAAERMWAAHERAKSHIFTQRNAKVQQQLQQQQRGGPATATPVLDLHGLHVQEVRQLLPQQLQELQASRQQSINIIVGAGRHTKGPPSARLAPAVEALLQELGYTYKQLQPGLLRVQLH